MTAKPAKSPLFLPRPIALSASGIALYKGGDEFTLPLEGDITAIVGANGLGKSTLLNLIIYALCGIVRKPEGPVDTIKGSRGFLDQGIEHAIAYFEGRVNKGTKPEPHVTITFRLGSHTIKVSRRFFFTETVTSIVVDGKNETPRDRSKCEEVYRSLIQTLGRFASYEQFAFLVYTVQYFGEDHYCLFWQQLVLNQIVTTIVRSSTLAGETMAGLIQEFKKHDSHFRNIQWQITKQREIAQELASTITEQDLPKKVVQRYGDYQEKIIQLKSRLVDLADAVSRAASARDESRVQLDEINLKLEAHMWKAMSSRKVPLAKSPLLQQLTISKLCPVCRTSHSSVPPPTADLIAKSTCPLCRADATMRGTATSVDETAKALRDAKKKAEARAERSVAEYDECSQQYVDAQGELSAVQSAIEKLEATYRRTLLEAALRASKEGTSATRLEAIEQNISVLTKRKEMHTQQRKEAAKQLAAAQKDLMEAFAQVKDQVIPKFQSLAKEFLGIPLTLAARSRREEQVPIVDFHITVEGSERKRAEQLSESQRYFVDIALRMTLLAWMSQGEWTPFLAIDTPEGALDIAYENNAGIMFGAFLINHNGALLTASNLNSSSLLRRTLQECHTAKKSVMLHDLRDYGKVTAVQKKHKPDLDAQIRDLRSIADAPQSKV